MTKQIEKLVLDAQKKWADKIINIGKAFVEKKQIHTLTEELLNLYAFEFCEVLFKPTLAKKQQFRSSKDEFISYFLGNNGICSEDKGFAIKKWKSIRYENYKISIYKDSIISMGNYFFEDIDSSNLKVEFTFGYIMIDNELKIRLHHSSLPYK